MALVKWYCFTKVYKLLFLCKLYQFEVNSPLKCSSEMVPWVPFRLSFGAPFLDQSILNLGPFYLLNASMKWHKVLNATLKYVVLVYVRFAVCFGCYDELLPMYILLSRHGDAVSTVRTLLLKQRVVVIRFGVV